MIPMALSPTVFRLVTAMVVSLVCGMAHATGDFLAWAEYDAWGPGRPDRHRQFYFHQDGTGQFFETLNEQIVRFGETDQSPFFASLALDQVLGSKENLETQKSQGPIVEGRGNKVFLAISSAGRFKFITADANVLASPMLGLRQRMVEPQVRSLTSFVLITVLPPSFKPTAEESSQMAVLSESLQDQFPEINKALASPFRLIRMSDMRWSMLQNLLGARDSRVYAKTTTNEMIKVQFYSHR
jgi:hypothetical protein